MTFFQRLILGRLDDVAFCRRLTLEGWEHLVTAEDQGRGVVLVSPAVDLWQVAIAAVGLYRGPVDVVARGSRLRGLPARWRRRFVGRALEPDDASGPASETLSDGGRILVLAEPEAGGLDSLAARLSSESGAPILSVATDSPRRGRYRIAVRPTPQSSASASRRLSHAALP